MLEYIFFHERPWTLFVEYLRQKGLDPVSDHEEQGYMVRLPEDTDDDLMGAIETRYDELLDLNEALFSAGQEDEHLHTAGVSVALNDGRTVQAAVEPELLGRLLQVVSADELGRFVSAIVDAVENPDERSICRR
ncbi:MAG: hypothetical protein ABW089_06815 [Sedimenticola sp.]